MSEIRKVKAKVNPSEFVEVCTELGFEKINENVFNVYGVKEEVDFLLKSKHLVIGMRGNQLIYDNMDVRLINGLLGVYMERKLLKKGFKVDRVIEENKIVLKVRR